MAKALTELDGPSWREKLPPIPSVPLPVKEKFLRTANSTLTAQQNNLNGNKCKKIYIFSDIVNDSHCYYLYFLFSILRFNLD